MTSPVGGKPSYEGAGYEQVHSEGSGFGQDLSESSVRSMLSGDLNSPFDGALNAFFGAIAGLGAALGRAVDRLFGGTTDGVDPTSLHGMFEQEAFLALEPIHSLADEALDKAGIAQQKAEDLNTELSGVVGGDLQTAVDSYSGVVGSIKQKADEFSGWSSENQTKLNTLFGLALDYQAQVNGQNQIAWQTQTEYNEQNDEINRTQTEALMLHENQLVWMNETRTRTFTIDGGGTLPSNPWVYAATNANGRDYEFAALGSWQGAISTVLINSDGNSDVHHREITATSRGMFWLNSGQLGASGRDMVITVTPYWGNRKREYLLKPVEVPKAGVPGYGIQHSDTYTNDREGNPIGWDTNSNVWFKNISTKADQDVLVHSGGSWISYAAGSTIYPNLRIRAKDHRLIKFTEV